MTSERFRATYLVETPLPVDRAAEVLAGEQSSGTFVAVPGETESIRTRFGARVEHIEPFDDAPTPSLPGSRDATRRGAAATYHRAHITISWPLENTGYNLPTLVSTVQGNLYELSQFSGIKLLTLDLPPSFASRYPGPRFGVAGTRRLTNVHNRPLIGTIIKPSIGLSPQQTADLVAQLADAGIDFVKDDELMANPPHSPFAQRVTAVMRVINAHADRTGKKVMYAFNITDDLDDMLRHYEHVHRSGGTCAMLSLNSVGLAATKKISDLAALPIHGHRNGFGALNRHPLLGIDFRAYQTLWRLAGVDQLHVNGIANKFWEPDDSVVRSIQACLSPLFPDAARETQPTTNSPLSPILPPLPSRERAGVRGSRAEPARIHLPNQAILPVVSSGQTGLQAPETYRLTQTIDLLYQAGGGIMAHPAGPAAGVRALQQAWQAAVSNTPFTEYAKSHPELRQTIEMFSKPKT